MTWDNIAMQLGCKKTALTSRVYSWPGFKPHLHHTYAKAKIEKKAQGKMFVWQDKI